MNVYDVHPGLKRIEDRQGIDLEYVADIPESYASSISLLQENDTYYVAKTAVKEYENITDYRKAYSQKILSDVIIDTEENTWLMKYVHPGEPVSRPLPPESIVNLFGDTSFPLDDFPHIEFPPVQSFINMMYAKSHDSAVDYVRSWGRDYIIGMNNRQDIHHTIQHGDLLDKNILIDDHGRVIPLDPLPVDSIWYHDLARYIAWNRNHRSIPAREYVQTIREVISLPPEFETYVCAIMAIEFARNFEDSSYEHRIMVRENLIDLAPCHISEAVETIGSDAFVEGI